MEFTSEYKDKADDIAEMFEATFTQSEGPEAGQLIKDLVVDMLGTLTGDDMYVFSAIEGDQILGSIIFTRMTYDEDERTVFVLAPVAVATSQQGQGLGQRLINHGLQTLRDQGVDVALTYGDINFYAKVGFAQITEETARAPLPLQYPEGWMGQSLTQPQLMPLKGASQCVEPLNNPDHW